MTRQTMTIAVATRSGDKLREIREMLSPLSGINFVSLRDLDIPLDPAEDDIEDFDTFEENALAKARYFRDRTGLTVLADDSGLCVDALGGEPGVRSRRFANRGDLAGVDQDLANNEYLLECLADIPPPRTARYVCAIAIAAADGREWVVQGTVEGMIGLKPAGDGGFGYDPLFYVAELDATFAQVPAAAKNEISHRRRALEAAFPILRSLALN